MERSPRRRERLRRAGSSAALVVAMLLAALPTFAQPSPGTRLNGTLARTLDTKSAQVGDSVTLTDVSSANGSGDISGARLTGTVIKVVRAGQGSTAQLQMRFTRLRLRDGKTYVVNGIVTGTQAKTKSNALKEAGGAVAGMLVGNAVGKTIGLNGGGIVGAAGGYLVAKNSRENMTIPSGSIVNVQLESARRQAQ